MSDIEACENDHLVLISGGSATGKSACLMGLNKPESKPDGVWYLNCENNKKLPFKAKFQQFPITDPLQVYEAFDEAENDPDCHTIVIDSLTYLMNMYETEYVMTSTNTQKAWGEYSHFLQRLFSQYIARSSKNVVIIAHTSDKVNDDNILETLVQIKGSIMKIGVESFFSTVVSTKKVPLKKLKDYESDMLNITEEEEMLGFKYVFQTKLTKETVHERMRSSMGMWSTKETFIDNDITHVIGRLHEYYDEE